MALDYDELIAPVENEGAVSRESPTAKGCPRRRLLEVAKREGVTFDEAREHSRAVFRSLREAIPDKEFRDTAAQLPKDYAALMARP